VLSPTGATGDSTPTFTWREVDGAVRYDLWVDQIGGQNQIIREQNLTGTSFTPGTSLADGNYRVWVRAISSTNETSDWSLTVTFSIVDSSLLPEDGEHGTQLAVLPEAADDADTPDVPGDVTEYRIAESRRIAQDSVTPEAPVTPVVAPTSNSEVEVRRAATDAAFADWMEELAAHV